MRLSVSKLTTSLSDAMKDCGPQVAAIVSTSTVAPTLPRTRTHPVEQC